MSKFARLVTMEDSSPKWEDLPCPDGFLVSVGFTADRTRVYLEIEVGEVPEGKLYTEENPRGITGDGSLSGLRGCWKVIEEWLSTVPSGTMVIAEGGCPDRHSAYRWLVRKGFAELWWPEPPEMGSCIARAYVKIV